MVGVRRLCLDCGSPARYDATTVGQMRISGWICINDDCAKSWEVFGSLVVHR